MNDYQKYLADEFVEEFQEGRISRREALRLIASVTGSVFMATTMLSACSPGEEPAESIPTTGAPSPAAAPSAEAAASPEAAASAEAAGAGKTPLPTPSNEPTASASPAAPASQGATRSPEAAAQPANDGPNVPEDDPDVRAQEVKFTGADGAEVTAYLARPASEETRPVVLVCHENRGLTAHIRDVARRLAKAGYVALAVDLLSRQGGTPSMSPGDVPGALGSAPPQQFIDDFLAGWNFLKRQPGADTAKVGMVGFCFGGGVTWRMAVAMPELLAAVPFYGPHPPVEDVPKIRAAVMAIYGGNDTRINAGIPAIEEAMKANGKIYEKHIYEGADHAFHNDTSDRYNPEAARDAWAKTLDWFEKYLA